MEFDRLIQAGQFLLIPLLPQDVLDLDTTRGIPEMHDRMIVALARRIGATCLTRDTEIVASGLIPIKWE